MYGSRSEQIAGDEGDHCGITAAVLTHVEDDRIGTGENGDRRCCGLASQRRSHKSSDVHVTYISGEPLDPGESKVLTPRDGPLPLLQRLGTTWRWGRRRWTLLDDVHPEMQIMANGAKVFCQELREPAAARDAVVFLAPLARTDRLFHLLRDLGEHVRLVQCFERAVDHLGAGSCVKRDIRGLRGVLRNEHRGRGEAATVGRPWRGLGCEMR